MNLSYSKIRNDHLQAIFKMTKSMASMDDETDILNMILSELMGQTGAEVGAFVYYNRAEDKFETRNVVSGDPKNSGKISFSQTVFRKVLDSKEALLLFDTNNDDSIKSRDSIIINDIHAILAFPLMIMNQVYGVMYFDSRKNRQHFNETSRQLLSFFAPIASLTLEQVLSRRDVRNENIILKSRLDQEAGIPSMIGETAVMEQMCKLIRKVAPSDVSVVITGENGTGKELVALAIHDLSSRKDKPYLAQYVGNIPAGILESELFGYKKGAFTGADQDKPGLFEAVSGGTLFLDEIGDLSMELQTKLLRVLQNNEIKRLGENVVRKVDVRIIAATHQDLSLMVRQGKFREDLYYRLSVININVPVLRERIDDIPLLVKHFLEKHGPGNQIKISKTAIQKLMDYQWPGNVRQLENAVKRAIVLIQNDSIGPDDFEFNCVESEPFMGTLDEYKNKLIIERLRQFKGNKTRAAKSLGISLRYLQLKFKELTGNES